MSGLVYGFDFFDTLVHRDCNPEVILYEWSRKIARYLKFRISTEQLYKARKEAGRINKKDNCEEIKYEELIYRLFQTINNLDDIHFNDFYRVCYNTEIDIEEKHIKVDKECVNYVLKLKREGNTIVLISDYYMGYPLFEHLLSVIELDSVFDRIYISSEIGKRKSTGKLFLHIIDDLNISPASLVMCGDNTISDVKIPSTLGIKTQYRPYYDVKHYINQKSELEKEIKKVVLQEPIDNSLASYSCECLFFVDKLYEELIKRGFRKVLFCSREGQFIKKLFDEYQERFWRDSLIHTEYFYISRRSILVPSLKNLEEEDFKIIFRQFPKLTMHDFLKTIGFEDDLIYDYTHSLGISMDEIIDSNSAYLEVLKNNKSFVDRYDNIRNQQKELFLNYFNHLGFQTEDNQIAIVDVGWKGTMQDCLSEILSDKLKIYGFYLGIRANQYINTITKQKEGLLFSDIEGPTKEFRLLERACIFYEKLFAANHGPVIGYRYNQKTKQAEPLIDNSVDELKLYSFMREYQEGLQLSIVDMIAIYYTSLWRPAESYSTMIRASLWRQCFCIPRLWRIINNSYALTEENFGRVTKSKIENNTLFKDLGYKSEMLFIDELYKYLDKHNLGVLYPLAHFYSHVVYTIKRIQLKV